MGAVELAPAGTVAAVEGRSGGAVFVIAEEHRFRVQAGHPDHPAGQLTLERLAPETVAVFTQTLASRTSERPHVPYDEAFPASAQLRSPGGAVLNVYDDGDDFSVMVVDSGAKAGTGTGVTLTAVRDFAAALQGSLGPLPTCSATRRAVASHPEGQGQQTSTH